MNEKLNMEEMEQVNGGVANTQQMVEAVCEHCGAKGLHRMDSARTAVCSKCGKSINLIAQ